MFSLKRSQESVESFDKIISLIYTLRDLYPLDQPQDIQVTKSGQYRRYYSSENKECTAAHIDVLRARLARERDEILSSEEVAIFYTYVYEVMESPDDTTKPPMFGSDVDCPLNQYKEFFKLVKEEYQNGENRDL